MALLVTVFLLFVISIVRIFDIKRQATIRIAQDQVIAQSMSRQEEERRAHTNARVKLSHGAAYQRAIRYARKAWLYRLTDEERVENMNFDKFCDDFAKRMEQEDPNYDVLFYDENGKPDWDFGLFHREPIIGKFGIDDWSPVIKDIPDVFYTDSLHGTKFDIQDTSN